MIAFTASYGLGSYQELYHAARVVCGSQVRFRLVKKASRD
jgi:hypothetical protein